ncbi:MAG TPA: ATP-dependent RNA helicase RhlE [Marinobacter adhaerens]|uniref:ATP-dependent RNA helicase RhlE n=1 Tax=Marinobacter adhaerens TaxID=1033846 RepID=A0A352IYW8_9GAMM|nr:ATP-dependent RNA helicase RhlE [Marinobacter adhaerens]
MHFSSLDLAPDLQRGLAEYGYSDMTPVQQQAIVPARRGKDLQVTAQTGTGKTAAFAIPLLQQMLDKPKATVEKRPRALILTPTRELAEQIGVAISGYAKFLPLTVTALYGGVKMGGQTSKLAAGVDIVISTPGRLLEHLALGNVILSDVEFVVLDEADRMLDMGFIRDIRKILSLLPAKRQNLLFSATFSNEIRTLAEGLLDNPVQVEVAARNTSAENIKQSVYPVDQSQKTALLSKLVRDNSWDQVLVFTRTKHGANRLTQKLEKDGITAAAIHGNKSQGARTRALADFKAGEVRVLVATDIAARGLDIKQLPQVVNFELPNVPEDYVHRIGRTGRAGESGHALSLVSADEGKMLAGIERLIKKQLPRTEVEGFEPTNNLPLKPKAKADPSRARTRSSNGGGNGRPGGKPKSFGDKPGGRSGGRSQNGGGQRSRSAQRQSA